MHLFKLAGLLLAVILGLLSAPAGAPPPGAATQPNPQFKDALWVAESEQALKLALADGTVLLEIPLTGTLDALAVDEASGTLWAFGEGRLHAYSFAGEKRYTVVPPYDRDDIDEGDDEEEDNHEVDGAEGARAFLTLNPNDGSLWLARHKSLYHYDREAQLLERIRLPKKAKALTLDPTRDEVWIGTKAGLQRYDAFGRPVDALLPALRHIRALAYERDGDALWVADKKRGLRRYALSDGALEHEVALPNKAKDVDFLVPDGRGGLWIGEGHTLIKLDREGEVQFHLKPFAGPGNDKLVALVADPVDGSAWAASRDRITKLSAEGERQQSFTPGSGNRKPKIQALALYLDTAAPVLSITAPAKDAFLNTNQPQFAFSYSDAGIGVDANTLALTLDEEALAVSCDHSQAKATCTPSKGLSEGAHTLVGTIADFHGHVSVPSRVSFMVDTVAPAAASVGDITVSDLKDDEVTITGKAGAVEPGAWVTITNIRSGESVTVKAGADGSFSAEIPGQSGDTFQIRITDLAGNTSEWRPLAISNGATIPPDPATIASPLSSTGITPMAEAVAFLYTGANAIQTGVEEGAIEARRAAVIRGKVLDRADQPLPGVTLTIKDHPEFGQTVSRQDGMFDLAVNGGGQLTLEYQRPGFLPLQRHVQTPWQDFALADDVVMIPLDGQVTTVDLSSSSWIQVARSSLSTDADGSRQASVLFPQGTQATMTLPDGTTEALTTINVRATEYTVGANGPKAMPAPLPPTSGYTYAVELSVDEALAAGATRVDFSQPLPVYVDNFLDFPVGGIVPAGWYDREKSAWIPSDNGRIVKVLGIDASGLAELDIEGNGQVADPTALAELGVTDAERAQLATLYAPGKSLWRVPVTHFTPWDCNWPYGPPEDSEPPPVEEPETSDEDQPDPEDSDECEGCSIEAQSQTLGEEIPITGTPFSLHYRSDRVPGRKTSSTLEIPLSGDSVPASLERIDLKITVAGQEYTQSFTPAANLSYTYLWDGNDAYARPVMGLATASVDITYVYSAVYYAPGDFGQAFAAVSESPGVAIGSNRTAGEITLATHYEMSLGAFTPAAAGLGGWSLSAQHAADPAGQVLYLGTGDRRNASSLGRLIFTVAGNGVVGYSGDGGPATQARLGYPTTGATLAPDASLYISDEGNNRIRRVDPDGRITTVAGNGGHGYSGDGGPATQASLNSPRGVALAPDGSLYIADLSNNRIRRVGPDGGIITVAGNGVEGYSGDGGPATQASLKVPHGVALAPDGSLYIADTYNHRIRRVGPDGRITTVAGDGLYGYGGDGGPATQTSLTYPNSVTLAPDGSLFIADTSNLRIRRVGPDGRITTVAGNGVEGYSGDGGPATHARLRYPTGVAFAPDGSLYVADAGNNRIRRVDPDGRITTVAGNGVEGYSGDGGPATQASLNVPYGVALAPSGSLYIPEFYGYRIRRVASGTASIGLSDLLMTSASGAEVYHFNPHGRHLRTLDTLTNTPRYSFAYDAQGRLLEITDRDGDITRIERDGEGIPAAIVSADGQRTSLTLESNGYLASVTNPAGERHTMAYTAEGLMTAFTDPKGNINRFEYDDLGRLMKDTNAGGGGWTITHTENASGYTNAMTTAEGRTTTFKVEPLSTGDRRQVNTYPNGTVHAKLFKTNGEETTTAPDGTVTTILEGPDPRFGMLAPVPSLVTTKLPSGLTATAITVRTATLTDPYDPLSLSLLSDTLTFNGKVYKRAYDAATKTWTRTSPAGRQSTRLIDPQGRPLTRHTAGLEPVRYRYDHRGRLTEATTGQADETRTTSIRYYEDGPSKGYVEAITDALGRTVEYDYDLAGRVVQETLPDGREIAYTYDSNGNVTEIVPPGQPPHRFDYTPLDQEHEYTPPDLGDGDPATRYRYNLDKQLTRITRPDFQTVELSYTSAGRLDVLHLPSGDYRYAYNPTTGQLSTLTAPDGGSVSVTYDGFLPQSTTWAGALAGTVSRSYNTDFQVRELSVNAGPIAFGYEADGLLTKAGALTLTRDPQHGLLSASALGNTATARSYNGFGELSSDKASYNGTTLYEVHYSRDKLGRISRKVETIDGNTTTTDYTYDPAGRLSEVNSNGAITSYSYDANGNRLKKTEGVGAAVIAETTANYDTQDRLLQYGDRSYSYTANGELLTKTLGTQTTNYDYDVLGNLRAVTLTDGTRIDYLIDGQNRRIGKKVNGILVQGFLYQDQLKPIAELDGNNILVSRFVYADKSNVPAYMIKEGVTYRIVSDHLGSPRLVINTTDGTVVQRMDYDEFGNVITDTKLGFQPFGFAGGLYDQHTKLERFGARDYDPEAGRWTAKDPIMFDSSGWNLYTYAVNDPVNFFDRNGLYEETVKKVQELGDKSAKPYGDLADFVNNPNKYNANDLQQQYKELWTGQTSRTGKQAAEDRYFNNPLKRFLKWCKGKLLGDRQIPNPKQPPVPSGGDQ